MRDAGKIQNLANACFVGLELAYPRANMQPNHFVCTPCFESRNMTDYGHLLQACIKLLQ